MRVAGLMHPKEALDIEFVKSMRSISSWIHDVTHESRPTGRTPGAAPPVASRATALAG